MLQLTYYPTYIEASTSLVGVYWLLCIKKKNMKHERHGDSQTKFYRVWVGMLARCTNINTPHYHNYGGRGITVCEEWMLYPGFKKDMQASYKDGLTLDRTDVNEGYNKTNCRWVTQKEQCRNTRNNVKYKGELASDASLRLGGKDKLVSNRIGRGWSLEKAFTFPRLKSCPKNYKK